MPLRAATPDDNISSHINTVSSEFQAVLTFPFHQI